jgi:nucleotide-binding universal stress UspA family protein
LGARAAQLRAIGLDVTCDVQLGVPSEIIVETARRCHAMLIAMATHGASGLRRWALGSVTDKVVQAAATPVLVVRGSAETQPPPKLDRILVPLDGSEFAKQALPLAGELAASANAELVLFQAVSPTLEIYHGMRLPEDTVAMICDQGRTNLEALAADLRSHAIPVETALVVGNAAEQIVEAAAEQHADLLVMATHGYSGIKRWALGSVADKVLHAARTPLLLIRARQDNYSALR